MENSKRLSRQARPGLEPGTCRLPAERKTAQPLVGQGERGKGKFSWKKLQRSFLVIYWFKHEILFFQFSKITII